jgi:hypothetical protein
MGEGEPLVVLAARESEREPIARVPLPPRIPCGLHGSRLGDRSGSKTRDQRTVRFGSS